MAVYLPDNKQFNIFVDNTNGIIERLSAKAAKEDISTLEKLVANFKYKTEDFYRTERKLNIGVIGQVKAKTLNLYGSLQGTAEVENLFIAGTARLLGDAVHQSIAIEPGAYIEGRCIRVNTGNRTTPAPKPEIKVATKVETPTAKKVPADNSNLFKGEQAAK